MVCSWGTASKLRCAEIVVGILNDPTRIDHMLAAHSRAFIDARRMLMKSQERMDRLITDLKLYKGKGQGVGPMHGY